MITGVEIPCGHCAAVNSVDASRISAGPSCGRCKAPLVAGKPLEVSDEQLGALVAGARLPVLVDFWAAWCPPCRAIAPHVAAVAERQAGRLLVAKVDTDRHQRHMSALGIRSIPTLVVWHGGNPVARQAGARSAEQLEQWLAPWVG